MNGGDSHVEALSFRRESEDLAEILGSLDRLRDLIRSRFAAAGVTMPGRGHPISPASGRVSTDFVLHSLRELRGEVSHGFTELAAHGGRHTTRKVTIAMQLQDNQQVTLSVSENDAAGNPVTASGLAWSVDNPSILTLTDNGDGTYTIAATGLLGTATVTAADSTVNPPLVGSLAVDVVSGPAVAVVITPGSPAEKAAPAAA